MAGHKICLAVLLSCFLVFFSAAASGETSERAREASYSSWTDDFVYWWSYARIPLFTFVMGSFGMTWYFLLKYQNVNGQKASTTSLKDDPEKIKKNQSDVDELKRVKIFYGTQTGTAKEFAEALRLKFDEASYATEVYNMSEYDPEDKLVDEIEKEILFIFVISTYTNGEAPESAKWFYKYIVESSDDCRMPKGLLGGLKYAVFGLGNSLYENNFNLAAKTLDKSMHKLSGIKIFPTGLGDENLANSKNGGLEGDFNSWMESLLLFLTVRRVQSERKTENCKKEDGDCCKEDQCCKEDKCCKEDQCCKESNSEEVLYESSTDDEDGDDEEVVDVEDLGKMANKLKEAKVGKTINTDGVRARKTKQRKKKEESTVPADAKEMVTPLIRKNLEKQGYKVVGSHSGVKICRWTKAMLRGRGGCYKHTFYGINSHQCMETTPSLACANKCVFCWRHHTNPVGTEWRWQMDDPDLIVDGAMQNHYNMIKQFRGVPGVLLERFQEGMQIQHCALSLVGEPIMYPKINEMVDLLHSKKISSFLVTNAQFPDAIRTLKPVTQLYVSVDASDKDSLKKIDRPLFRDYWQRFIDSLKALNEKGQRTVYRLTLVKSFNTDEIEGYAKLVEIGNPSFIEVKGVTYCGESKASTLTMKNVPWHQEVVDFVNALCEKIPEYELASEHEHSNCVLLAHKRFKINDVWHTWIDYPKFHDLMSKYDATNGREAFSDMDYIAPTPHWAVFGDVNRGFDPKETRFYRKKRKDISGC
ncbi:S-adenosyl-L-methionine-dependent tRNA 4-demethylwyosine synthase TYW1-like isoform X2 [Rhopilema esculentum]|uniref:S-adenosyl-L-methionine-dependent tRNA 4-demethylwyosine synthase TYW1-like isoform X2 n=1 Tax=Rhopilema esculentum TaxID=499914 RepID=UPI0031D59CDD